MVDVEMEYRAKPYLHSLGIGGEVDGLRTRWQPRRPAERCKPARADAVRSRWDEAERALVACKEVGIGRLETYYGLFASRITALRETALPRDWNGSFVMIEK